MTTRSSSAGGPKFVNSRPCSNSASSRADNMEKMKETYVALAIQPDHTRYGWMRV